uniref:Cytochrome c assembly protein domain-containing protein n=1 Tax=Spirodela intermedia TaxID=51605 RepID=A0A8S0XM50_SPIIN
MTFLFTKSQDYLIHRKRYDSYVLSITGLLVIRWIYSGHFPLSNLYESLMFLSAITTPSAIFTQAFATSGLSTEMHQSSILVPALRSHWLMMHVSMMLLSYAALLVGSLFSIALLVITFRKISKFLIYFLTIGILSGAVWANEAWGSYWNWDPKETWAFITWTIYAIYSHTRTTKNWQGVNSAIVASIGFLIIWICYFGVNLLGIGLHSYGSFILS